MAVEAKFAIPLHRLVLERLEEAINDFRSCGHEYPTMGRFRHTITGEVDQWLRILHHADLDLEARQEVDEKMRELCNKASWEPMLEAIFAAWGFNREHC